jgi:2-polyprenyl-3-methyl-5-hydroxy-6-metoxy-1,4-benzoquinol methylase
VTLIIPDTRVGRGTAHIRRSIDLLHELVDARLLISSIAEPGSRSRAELEPVLSTVNADRLVESIDEGEWDRIVVDKMMVTRSEIVGYLSRAMTIGIDLGGEGREYASYVIDTLPRLGGKANESDIAFLRLPDPVPLSPGGAGRVLVSFGGEDPAELTEPTVEVLMRACSIAPQMITVIRPTLRPLGLLPDKVAVLEPQPSLWRLFEEHEWVVTAFGLTAFEAAAAGRRVVTVAPGSYHDQLSRVAGLVRCGVSHPVPRLFRRAIAHPDLVLEQSQRARPVHRRRMAELIRSLVPPSRLGSAAVRGAHGPAVWRGREKSYFTCPETGIVYLQRFVRDEETYSSSYFEEEYRAHYGRTYLDDFDNIKTTGERRLSHILSLAACSTVLDIGCAFGPFLSAAADAGIIPYGIDVSPEAIAYVTSTFGYRAVQADVRFFDPAAVFRRTQFDAVTLWYVIEHFDDLDRVLERVAAWVLPGGVLAISTPAGHGISARRNESEFYEGSPRDHHTVWSRHSAPEVLRAHGFHIAKIVSTGHHPERYPAVQRGVLPPGIAALHSWLFGLGDTFEIYALKEQA